MVLFLHSQSVLFLFLASWHQLELNRMSTRSGERTHAFLVPEPKGKVQNFLCLRMISAAGLLWVSYVWLRKLPSVSRLLSLCRDGCWLC